MGSLIQQKTLMGTVKFAGITLHAGAETSVRILPGGPDTGYRFRRIDIPGAPEMEATVKNISDTLLATSVGLNGASVKTVEHLLSGLAGSGVDNAAIEVDGDEIPILDGSAVPFVRGIERIGLVDQGVPKKMIRILKEIETGDQSARASLSPAETFSVNFTIDFANPTVGRQSMEFDYTPEAYRRDIAFARTFGFMKDVKKLREKGLALGGSLDNAVVVGDDGVLNPDGLRAPDEFVRHKILDTIGDLSLLGIPILGAYCGYRAGHAINRILMQEVLANPDRWELVCLEERKPDRIFYRPILEGDLYGMRAVSP